MDHLRASAKTAVELVKLPCTVRILSFDTHLYEIVPETTVNELTKQVIQSRIDKIQNLGHLTNMEVAIEESIKGHGSDQFILVFTDGLSNCGQLMTSRSLTSHLISHVPEFLNNTFHTIGLQLEKNQPINSLLLKNIIYFLPR